MHKVTTIPLRENILEQCTDLWASEVQDRLHGCINLVPAEAIYHDSCFSRFMLNKQLNTATAKKTQGRPEDEEMGHCCKQLCQWLDLEAGSELYTVAELHAKMVELSAGAEVYTTKRLKQKLQEHYGECVIFAEVEGRDNVVCFRNMAKYIINEQWYLGKKDNIADEAERIVVTAAKIVRDAIREKQYNVHAYPTNEDIKNNDQGT